MINKIKILLYRKFPFLRCFYETSKLRIPESIKEKWRVEVLRKGYTGQQKQRYLKNCRRGYFGTFSSVDEALNYYRCYSNVSTKIKIGEIWINNEKQLNKYKEYIEGDK
jgi:hypothetical protein